MSTQPLAMNVLITPMPVCSQNMRSCWLARMRMQPLPARITGRRAARSIAKARSTCSRAGTGRRKRIGSIAASSVSALATSSGSSRCTAPGFSLRARRIALRTISGRLSGRMMLALHLVTGRNIRTASIT